MRNEIQTEIYICATLEKNIYFISFQREKKNSNSKNFAYVGFSDPKVPAISGMSLKLVWNLKPNKSLKKNVTCLIFTRAIVFHPYFMEKTLLISTA